MAGDYATRTGEWTQVLTPTDGGEPITEVGRCVVAFKKVAGEWKVAWEIWNTFEPSTQTN
jgi:ketosteroid isomerase-like protein